MTREGTGETERGRGQRPRRKRKRKKGEENLPLGAPRLRRPDEKKGNHLSALGKRRPATPARVLLGEVRGERRKTAGERRSEGEEEGERERRRKDKTHTQYTRAKKRAERAACGTERRHSAAWSTGHERRRRKGQSGARTRLQENGFEVSCCARPRTYLRLAQRRHDGGGLGCVHRGAPDTEPAEMAKRAKRGGRGSDQLTPARWLARPSALTSAR